MSRSRLLSGLLLTAVVITLGIALPGCESKPAAPEYDNPFDGQDPLGLKASVTGNSILLTWTNPPGMGITSYDISHSLKSNTDYEYLDTVDAATPRYTYQDPAPTAIHYFKVQAFNEADDYSLVADVVPAFVTLGPAIAVNGDPAGTKVPSRDVVLTVTVSSEDSIQVADNADFTGAVSYPVVTPGAGQDIPWPLPQAAQQDTFTVFARGFTGTLASATSSRDLIVDFSPEFSVVGKPATVATRRVDLQIDDAGVEQMRFATNEDALASTAWLPADSLLTGFLLDDVASAQTIFGEFQGDFGFNATTDWNIKPELLQGATFRLDLTDGDVVAGDTVIGLCSAKATFMRFSNDPSFAGAAWEAYADTATITLAPAAGLQTIYAQFRNDWVDSGILTDTVVHVVQPVSVGFLAPLDGQIVFGGVSLQVRGFSTSASGKAAAESLAVDLADGLGFRTVAVADPWSVVWDVPRFDADTELTLRAQAWSGEATATTQVQVTVTQLTLDILAPLAGSELAADTDVVVTGTAGGLLGGAAVDSVTLDIDGQVLTAEGTDNWSATWHTPAVTASTPYTIEATVVAGDDRYSREIAVSVAPVQP